MTALVLTGFVNALISVLLGRVPGLRARWEPLSSEAKSMWIGILLILSATAFTGLSCAGVNFQGYSVACTQEGIMGVVVELGAALLGGLAGSQGMYSIAVRPYRAK